MPKIRIPRDGYSALATIIEHAAKLPLLSACVDNPDATSSVEIVASRFAAQASLPKEAAKQIVSQLLTLHSVREKNALSAEKLFDSLTQSIEADGTLAWREANLDAWRTARENVVAVIQPVHPLGVFEKGIRLAFEHPHVLQRSRIITDIRPVFDQEADRIQRMIVTHHLSVEYAEPGDFGPKTLSLALDAQDIKNLRRLCERAEKKARIAQLALKQMDWPTVIVGDSDEVD